MRAALVALATTIHAQASYASSYFGCTAPLIVATDPLAPPAPELEFVLTLGDYDAAALAFVAQGHAFDGDKVTPLHWRGAWMLDADMLHMIGVVKTDHSEWRAQSSRKQDDVLILNISRSGKPPLMVRCLPQDGA